MGYQEPSDFSTCREPRLCPWYPSGAGVGGTDRAQQQGHHHAPLHPEQVPPHPVYRSMASMGFARG